MNENPRISVIIPVYKVEPYLDRCVRSIVEQTYQNLEIILVDDGSPDRCPELCDAWAEKDARIQVYHKPNGGLSNARNYGVARSTGEYIAFVDSDDYVAQNYIEYLYTLMIQTGAEMACCNFRKVQGDDADFANQPASKLEIMNGHNACLAMYQRVELIVAWGKLYRRERVLEHPYPVGRLHEDEAVTYKLLYECSAVAVGNQQLYAYYENSGGIMHNRGKKNEEDILLSFRERADFFRQMNDEPLYAYSTHDYLCRLMDFWDKPQREKAAKLLGHYLFDSRIFLKSKIKLTYYLIFGKAYHGTARR